MNTSLSLHFIIYFAVRLPGTAEETLKKVGLLSLHYCSCFGKQTRGYVSLIQAEAQPFLCCEQIHGIRNHFTFSWAHTPHLGYKSLKELNWDLKHVCPKGVLNYVVYTCVATWVTLSRQGATALQIQSWCFLKTDHPSYRAALHGRVGRDYLHVF